MSNFIGRKISIGFGKETTRGTKVAPTFWISQGANDFEDKFASMVNENGLGIIENSTELSVIKQWSEGKVDLAMGDKTIGAILLMALGAVSSAAKAGETVVYEHSFSVLESSQHPSFSIEMKDGNQQLAFPNGMLKSLDIDIDMKSYIKATLALIAKKGVTAADTVAYTSENLFLGRYAKVYFADTLAALDSATAITLRSLKMGVDKNVESNDTLGSVEPADFLNKNFNVDGQLELLFDDATYKTLALAGTAKCMRIKIINTDVTIGTSSNPTLQIDFAKVKFEDWGKSGGLNDIVKQTLKFRALYSVADSKMITAKLTNLQTSY